MIPTVSGGDLSVVIVPKADDPVTTGLSNKTATGVYGCPAFAGHDDSEVSPACIKLVSGIVAKHWLSALDNKLIPRGPGAIACGSSKRDVCPATKAKAPRELPNPA
jgi:hypothetical protein